MRRMMFMIIDVNKLKLYDEYGEKIDNGYRVVYFFENHYRIGSFASDIKTFMYDFVDEPEPWNDDVEIPKFISKDDLLNRYLTTRPKIIGVAIYKMNGTLVLKKERKS